MATSIKYFNFAPRVSVIIPVYNDSRRLAICLEALENQTYPKSCYEVIVVDNGSKDNVKNLVYRFPHVVLANEDRPGSYAARNRGISVATGEVVAFTDSDCIPDPDWLERGVAKLQGIPNCSFVGGRIALFFKNQQKLTPVEIYESIHAFDQKTMVERYQHAATANLFTFKKVFDSIGLFNASLMSGGDVEWGKRVFASGYRQIYAEDVRVAHPARHSFYELYRKTARVVGGIYDLEEPGRYSASAISKDLLKLTIFMLALLRRAFCGQSPFDKLDRYNDRLGYIFVVGFVGVVKVLERLRLRMGQNSKKR